MVVMSCKVPSSCLDVISSGDFSSFPPNQLEAIGVYLSSKDDSKHVPKKRQLPTYLIISLNTFQANPKLLGVGLPSCSKATSLFREGTDTTGAATFGGTFLFALLLEKLPKLLVLKVLDRCRSNNSIF